MNAAVWRYKMKNGKMCVMRHYQNSDVLKSNMGNSSFNELSFLTLFESSMGTLHDERPHIQ